MGNGRAGPDAPRKVQLFGAGTILREVIAAASILEQDYGVAADIWSATSFTELRREGLECVRWNRLNPEQEPREHGAGLGSVEGHGYEPPSVSS